MSTLYEEIVSVVSENPRPTSAWDLVYTLGLTKEEAQQSLKRARTAGKIARLCRGRYVTLDKKPDVEMTLLEYRISEIHDFARGRVVTSQEIREMLGDTDYHATRRAILASDLTCVGRVSARDSWKLYTYND